MSRIDVNVIIGNVNQHDLFTFFCDINNRCPPDETWLEVGKNFLPLYSIDPNRLGYAKLLAALGVFPSASDARRNGWGDPIPQGWKDLRIGKLKHRICILKNTTGW